eukprot:2377792-Rhodomonas_salina.1
MPKLRANRDLAALRDRVQGASSLSASPSSSPTAPASSLPAPPAPPPTPAATSLLHALIGGTFEKVFFALEGRSLTL